jgi:Tol biopolymer transport system component
VAAQEEFFLMDVAGGNPVVVLTADRILRASWRPGHSALAVTYKQAAATTHVAVYDIGAKSLRQVESLQSDRPFLCWSRDGETLNYVTSGSGRAEVQSYDARLNARTVEFPRPEYTTNPPSTNWPAPGNLDSGNEATDQDTVLVNY